MAKRGSVLVSTVRPNLKGFAYVAEEVEDTIFSTGLAVLESKNEQVLLNQALYIAFMFSPGLMEQMETVMGRAAYPSISTTDIESFIITVPSITEQQMLITALTEMETQVATAQIIIAGINTRKQEIIRRHLYSV